MSDPEVAGSQGEVVHFEARGAIVQLFASQSVETLVSGPAGTGKSRGILELIHYICMKYPGARALIVRKTLVSLVESGLVTYKDQVLHKLDGVYFFGGSKQDPAEFRYPNGSKVLAGGLDQDKVMSTEYDIIYVQEAGDCAEEDWETLMTRLRGSHVPFGRIIGDCNPTVPWHWILRRSRTGTLNLLESRHEDNPRYFRADGTKTPEGVAYIAILDNLTGVKKQRLRYGRWVAAEGVVYEEFDPAIHVIPSFKIPPEWRRIRSIDFGFQNPATVQWWAIDRDGRMYLYRELYRTQTLVSDLARRTKFLTGKSRIEATIADHDSEDRATLLEGGIPTIKARKAILPGIEEVQRRLRRGADGKARLYLFEDALVFKDKRLGRTGAPTCLAEEFNVYAWPPHGRREAGIRELPLDLHNHGCDATRYATMYLKARGRAVAPMGATRDYRSKWVGRHTRS